MRVDVAADGSPHANSSATDGHAHGDDADREPQGIRGFLSQFSTESKLRASFCARNATLEQMDEA